MKSPLPFLLALAVTPAIANAPQDQAYLGIFVETHVMQIAGMPKIEMPQLPPGMKLPANVMAMMPGRPHKTINVRLWSPSIAPNNANAAIAPPSASKLGDKLDLDLFRPTSAPTGGAVPHHACGDAR